MDAQDKVMSVGCAIMFAYILFILSLIGFAIWAIVKVMVHFGII